SPVPTSTTWSPDPSHLPPSPKKSPKVTVFASPFTPTTPCETNSTTGSSHCSTPQKLKSKPAATPFSTPTCGTGPLKPSQKTCASQNNSWSAPNSTNKS